MQKIPTLFLRDPDDMRRVTDQIHPDCGWVLMGEGVATRKYDGTCVMLDENGKWWARREVKKDKFAPENFVLLNYDEVTGKQVGWEPIEQSPFYKFFKEAAGDGEMIDAGWLPGTYELCGPKINGNPEAFAEHELIPHALAEKTVIKTAGMDSVIKDQILALEKKGWEGVVWHHPDGRMAKLKARDYKYA